MFLVGDHEQRLETPQHAVRRELLEETGLEVTVGRLVGVFPDRYGDDAPSTLNLFYQATVAGGQQRAADDVSEIGWRRPGEIDPAQLAFACCREALATIVRKS